jgi:putative transcriptional regulator
MKPMPPPRHTVRLKNTGRGRADMSRAGRSILKGAYEALEYATGRRDGFVAHVPEEVDVAAIRDRLGLSQGEFAARFGFMPDALKNWEQGRRRPEGPARALLCLIEREPELVRRTLGRTDAEAEIRNIVGESEYISMAQGRPPFEFALIDLPSDHEIDGGLVTESQVIQTILHNRRLGSRTKVFRATSEDGFSKISRPYKDLRFVHLATHGSAEGISLIGTHMSWSDVANKLKQIAPVLPKNRQRVLCLSCCHSGEGYRRMKSDLSGHFTGVYYFAEDKIAFSTAMTVWSMFYLKKRSSRPAAKIAKSINNFFEEDEDIIRYGRISRLTRLLA